MLYACDPSTLPPLVPPISHIGNTSRVLYARDLDFPARTLPWVGIAQCQSPARFLSCVVYRTSARAIYLAISYAGNTSRVLYARDFDFSAWTLPWIGIAQSIACLISQLRRVPNLCSCHLSAHLIRRQYPYERYTPVILFFSLGLYL